MNHFFTISEKINHDSEVFYKEFILKLLLSHFLKDLFQFMNLTCNTWLKFHCVCEVDTILPLLI